MTCLCTPLVVQATADETTKLRASKGSVEAYSTTLSLVLSTQLFSIPPLRTSIKRTLSYHVLCFITRGTQVYTVIFLKNVMIYFDADSKRTALAHLVSRLAPGGYLVIGLSEGVFDMLDPLEKRKPWLFQKASG